METFVSHSTVQWNKTFISLDKKDLVDEEPLSIRLHGKLYSVIIRTPGDEIKYFARFCLGEWIVDSPDDFASLAFCDGVDTNVITVTLKPSRREEIPQINERRGFISQNINRGVKKWVFLIYEWAICVVSTPQSQHL